MTETEAKVVAAWKEAATDLRIGFTSPFVVAFPDYRTHEHLGLVHGFGGRVGTLITVLHEPSETGPHPVGEYFYRSILGPDYTRYERKRFIDTLEDWKFFGPENERPAWYIGKSWT